MVIWSSLSHWVLGVPFDMVMRARREGYAGEAAEDLTDLARVYVLRLLRAADAGGLFLIAGGSFALTFLAVIGFGYGVEFAQALFLILLPMAGVVALSLRTARRILAADPDVEQLCRMMTRLRLYVQGIGVVSIFVTAMWGMLVNIALPSWY